MVKSEFVRSFQDCEQRLGVVIRPLDDLSSVIASCSNKVSPSSFHVLQSLSLHHLTLLYAPCRLIDNCRLSMVIRLLRSVLPTTLRYEGIRVSSHLTLQLLAHPADDLRALHLAILDMLDITRHITGEQNVLLSIFNTTNIGLAFSPHITLGRFRTHQEAEIAAQRLTALPAMEQEVSEIWIADATARLDYRFAVRAQNIHTNSMAIPCEV